MHTAAAANEQIEDQSAFIERAEWRSVVSDPRMILFAIAACLIPVGYAFYTKHIWEDSLTALRYSENLVRGEGLVYNPGERVQGFSSPLAVLLLALCSVLTGQSSFQATFWLYRIFSIAAFACSGVLLLRSLINATGRWGFATWFLGLAYLFAAKPVAFSTNGMESAFMLLFMAGCLLLFSQGEPQHWLGRGLCWAGLMWTRPDGCVYIAALSAGELIFSPLQRKLVFWSLAKSACSCALLYGPWFIWAWSYYGSPIPQTIAAKGNPVDGVIGQILVTGDYLVERLTGVAAAVFRPIYYGIGGANWIESSGWLRLMTLITKCAGLFCLAYWLIPLNDRLGRFSSFCFTVLSFYLAFLIMGPGDYVVGITPWYSPPVELFGLLTLRAEFRWWQRRFKYAFLAIRPARRPN